MIYTPEQVRLSAAWCRKYVPGPAGPKLSDMLHAFANNLDQPVIDDVPLPTGRKTFPFAELDVGGYFDAPLHKMPYLRNEAVRAGRRANARFMTSAIDDKLCRCMRFA